MTSRRFPARSTTCALGAVVALAVAAPVAYAAAKPGSYKGTSSGKIEVRVADPVLGVDFATRTDTGKVTFSVKGAGVKGFTLKGQKALCGGQNIDVDIKIASMKLNASGSGKGTFNHPNLGPQKVTIKVGTSGTASGSIKFTGLCSSSATFKARPK